MAVGEFLLAKKTFAPDDLTTLDLSAAVKDIKEGDSSVSFAVGDASQTPEQRLTTFINYLLTYGKEQYASFRRLKW
jgi:methionine aminopeptidase